MWPSFKSLLTTDTAQWYETLPFVTGFIFVGIELVVLISRRVRLHHYAPRLGYMLGEGITVCILPMYGIALVFDRTLEEQQGSRRSDAGPLYDPDCAYFRRLVFRFFALNGFDVPGPVA